MTSRSTRRVPHPFLRWAGGKDQMVDRILGLMPPVLGSTYYEPFLGGGAVFFGLRRSGFQGSAVLSDLNNELIDCYAELASNPDEVMAWLDEQPTTERHYFFVRNLGVSGRQELDPIVRAGRFLYLNRTCFNGLYRLGPHITDPKRLVFNVPWGKNLEPLIYDRRNIEAVATSLRDVRFLGTSYQAALAGVRAGDVVYFDPPYVPIKKSSFTRYTGEEFGYQEQEELAVEFERLVDLGARVILSNAQTPWVVDRYRRFEIHTLHGARSIAADGGSRQPVPEVLIVGRVEGEIEWQSRHGSNEPEPDSESSDGRTIPTRANRSSSRSATSSTPTRKRSNNRRRRSSAESGSSDNRSIENSSAAPSSPSSKAKQRRRTGKAKPPERRSSPASSATADAEPTTPPGASNASQPSGARSTISQSADKALYRILAVDPGESESGWVLLDDQWPCPRVLDFRTAQSNEELIRQLRDPSSFSVRPTHMAIETMQWRGQPMFWQSIATLIWIGRMKEAWSNSSDPRLFEYTEIVREAVKLYCCGATARKDQNVVAALLELYGGKGAKGDSTFPGPLYGIAKHAWQALGLGVTWAAMRRGEAAQNGSRV